MALHELSFLKFPGDLQAAETHDTEALGTAHGLEKMLATLHIRSSRLCVEAPHLSNLCWGALSDYNTQVPQIGCALHLVLMQ